MALDQNAINVLNRPLPKDKIQKRPGKAGMEFSYITPDFVIDTLNEAFSSDWSTRIVSNTMYDNVAVVGLELEVPSADGKTVRKQQFGSCEVTRGLGTGEAFKGAASDALKKCATLLGLGLELYKDDEIPVAPTPPQFRAPSRPAVPSTPARPSSPSAPARPVPPPQAPAQPKPPAPARPAAPVSSPVAPPKPAGNPFTGGNAAASVAKPAPPRAPAAPRENPFTSNAEASGPNSTQMNAMVNLADRKGITPAALISLAGVMDDLGNPLQNFEDLNRDQAIQVIKAAQQL